MSYTLGRLPQDCPSVDPTWIRPLREPTETTDAVCPPGYQAIGLRCIGPCGGYWCKPLSRQANFEGIVGDTLRTIPNAVWIGLVLLGGLSLYLTFRRRGGALSGLLIRADGTEESYLPAKKKFSLEELQKAVGGYIERVPVKLPGHKHMIVNEEGKLIGLPVNRKATRMVVEHGFPDVIVGDVLITEPEEGL